MTDFLFARPSFLSGMARALDLGATFSAYNRSSTGEEADSIAIYNDFKAIGDDLRRALKQEMDKGAGSLDTHSL
jgi:hypothetical protein